MEHANEGVTFLTGILGGYVGGWCLSADAHQLAVQLERAARHIHEASRDFEDAIERRLLRELTRQTEVGRKLAAAKSDKGAGNVARRYAATCRLRGVSADFRRELIELVNWRRLGRHVLAA